MDYGFPGFEIHQIHEIHGIHKCIFRKDAFKGTMNLMDLMDFVDFTSAFIWIWIYEPVENGLWIGSGS